MLWWKGPKWLPTEPPQLPDQPLASPPISTLELKASCNIVTGSTKLLETNIVHSLNSFASLRGLISGPI